MTGLELVRQWLVVADDDMDVAGRCLAYYPQKCARFFPCPHSCVEFALAQTPRQKLLCSFCPQCAEKALKAFLLFRETEPPRTHELPLLCTMCSEHDIEFEQIYDVCAKLTQYGVVMRYPLELPVDEPTAKAAIEQSRQVYEFCAAKIQPGSLEGPGFGE